MSMNKLRVGVILSDHKTPAWVRSMLEGIRDSSHAEVTALAFADQKNGEANRTSQFYNFQFQLDQRIFRPGFDPRESSDVRKILQNTQILGESLNERVSRLKAMRLDVLLNLSLDALPGFLLDVARFGVWSLRCNGARVTTHTETGWMEVLNDTPTMQCDVEVQRMETLLTVGRSVMAVHPGSITLNQRSFLWRASEVVPRLLRDLHAMGEQAFFAKAQPAKPADGIPLPTTGQLVLLAWKKFVNVFENKLWRRRFPHLWALMAGKRTEGGSFDWGRLSTRVPPRGAFWADPFILQRQNQIHLFFEEYLYQKKRGHISHAVMDSDENIGEPQIVLERPYHLSYPFIFEYRGEFYMMPETAQNRTIEIFRCTRFPDRWEFHKTIMQDVHAVDATLIEHAMRWWMFVNMAGKNGSTWDELHLYYSDDPISTNWTSHPMNPVISDVRSARPAGRIFRRDGALIRPSQDSSLRYGYALNLNRITKLTINEYEEELIERIEPNGRDILATHTYNTSSEFIVVDALLKR